MTIKTISIEASTITIVYKDGTTTTEGFKTIEQANIRFKELTELWYRQVGEDTFKTREELSPMFYKDE